jgi:hypothetical protein
MDVNFLLEGNKKICNYMGVKPKMESPDVYSYSGFPFFSVRDGNPEKVMESIVKYVKYNISWDWLMPVIGKISNECEEPEELDELKYALLCNDIETAWKFVVNYLD